MDNRQIAENFLDQAKDTWERSGDVELAKWRLEVAKVHALLALNETLGSNNSPTFNKEAL